MSTSTRKQLKDGLKKETLKMYPFDFSFIFHLLKSPAGASGGLTIASPLHWDVAGCPYTLRSTISWHRYHFVAQVPLRGTGTTSWHRLGQAIPPYEVYQILDFVLIYAIIILEAAKGCCEGNLLPPSSGSSVNKTRIIIARHMRRFGKGEPR